jgi:hypothetical protein
LQSFRRYLDQLLRQLDAGDVTQPEKRGVGDAIELSVDGIIEFFFSMSVDIAPERRNAVQILSTVNIDKIMTIASVDDARFLAHPLLHLSERMPKVSVV